MGASTPYKESVANGAKFGVNGGLWRREPIVLIGAGFSARVRLPADRFLALSEIPNRRRYMTGFSFVTLARFAAISITLAVGPTRNRA